MRLVLPSRGYGQSCMGTRRGGLIVPEMRNDGGSGYCSIDKGQLFKLVQGHCPSCGIGLWGHFGAQWPIEKWWECSCPKCGYAFSKVPGAPNYVGMKEASHD